MLTLLYTSGTTTATYCDDDYDGLLAVYHSSQFDHCEIPYFSARSFLLFFVSANHFFAQLMY